MKLPARALRQIRSGAAGIPATIALFAAISLQPAQALLIFNIFESIDGNVVVETSGSLNLPARTPGAFTACAVPGGAIFSDTAGICTGNASNPFVPYYNLNGPATFPATAELGPASSVSGDPVYFSGFEGIFAIGESYVSGTPIVSSATFNNIKFKDLGFTTFGQIGTWTLDGTGDQIQVVTPVPGPLPLFGSFAAFCYSRRLRRRISTSQATPTES